MLLKWTEEAWGSVVQNDILGLLNRSSKVAWLKLRDTCKSPSSKNSLHSAF